MECTVTWTGAAGTRSHMGFVAETGSGHVLTMDGAPDATRPEHGGANLAPRPMETLLAGTGGCTAYDVVLILKRGRHEVRGQRCGACHCHEPRKILLRQHHAGQNSGHHHQL